MLGSCQPLKGVGTQPEGGPPVHGDGAQAVVELAAGLVPVQDRPLDASAVPLHRYLAQPLQQGCAYAVAPELLRHVQVLQPQGGLGLEGAEGVVVESYA